MSLDRAITALDLLRPIAKVVPVAGVYLEGVVDLLQVSCKHAKEVKANKAESVALAERAVLCMTIVVEKMQSLPESEINTRTKTVRELDDLVKELVRKTEERSKRNRVSRTFRKTEDKEEIDNFTKRFNEILERFGVEVQLLTMYDVEKVLDQVKQLQETQSELREAQRQMQETQEQMKEVQIRAEQNALLDKLRPVATARHDHENAPSGCAENTRIGVLDLAFEWAINQLTPESIFWLAGLAGTGKTAIMKTLSQRLAAVGVLGGCFFVSLQMPSSRDPQNIVRSLVHQLAGFQPMIRESICSIIRNRPEIVDQEMALQIPTLLSDIFTHVLSQIQKPIVLMIDALDECEKKDDVEGGQLLPILIRVILQHPAKLKLIVSSRLTPNIQKMFESITTKRFRLHDMDLNIVASDIHRYLETEFEKIIQDRRLQSLYTSDDITKLVFSSKNLFIYAAIVVKWVANPRFMPKDRLHQILQWRPHHDSNSPYQPIDDLYRAILWNALGPNQSHHEEIGKQIQHLLEVLVVALRPLLISEVAGLLGREEDAVYLDLEQLSAVLIVPEKGSPKPVVIYHSSFIEYVTNHHRCGPEPRFYVSLWEAHGRIGMRCLDLTYSHRYGKQGSGNVSCGDGSQDALSYASSEQLRHLELSPTSSSYVQTAIEKIEQMVSKHSEEMDALGDLSYLLHRQSERTNEVEVLHKKVSIDRQLLRIKGPLHPDRDISLNNLALGIQFLYERGGDEQLLNEAVKLYREALELRPPGHPLRDTSLNNLALGLQSLYERSGDEQLLNEAVKLYRQALELRTPGHPLRDTSLSNLTNGLQSLYERSGDQQLLYEGVKHCREALELCPPGHPLRNMSLNNLANGLQSLYERSGVEQLLNEAVKLYQQALELHPPGHPLRDLSLNNLAFGLQSLYRRSGDEQMLNEAVKHCGEALELRPPGHPLRNTSLSILANGLQSLYERSGDQQLLIKAIMHYREALELSPPGHSFRDTSLNHLAASLQLLFKHNNDIASIEEAVQLGREAVPLTPTSHPYHSNRLRTLAYSLAVYGKEMEDQACITESERLVEQADALDMAMASGEGH